MKKRNTPHTPFSFFIFLFSFFILLLSCQKSTNPVQTGALNLELLDVTCTEAFFGLEFDPGYVNKTLRFYRDDSLIASRPLSAADTILLAEGLWPNTTYKFTATITETEKRLASSPALRVTTMDTTSHDFTWQSLEFGGQGGSSAFYDVAIIDEDDVWAVGEIYTADDQYNAAHWDGEKWELKKIRTNACGGVDYPPIKTVFSFSENNILFGHIDASITKYNGTNFINDCSFINQINGSINKIWGTSGEDLYVVGNKGLIAHYDGREWRRIESGTEENIQDIWGTVSKGNKLVLCAASQIQRESERKILNIHTDYKVTSDEWAFIDRKPYAIWFKNKYKIYACGDGVFSKKFMGNWTLIKDDIPIFMNHIRATNYNNIFTVGFYSSFVHFNGIGWQEIPIGNVGQFVSVDAKDNLAVSVGYNNRQGIITVIRKQ